MTCNRLSDVSEDTEEHPSAAVKQQGMSHVKRHSHGSDNSIGTGTGCTPENQCLHDDDDVHDDESDAG